LVDINILLAVLIIWRIVLARLPIQTVNLTKFISHLSNSKGINYYLTKCQLATKKNGSIIKRNFVLSVQKCIPLYFFYYISVWF